MTKTKLAGCAVAILGGVLAWRGLAHRAAAPTGDATLAYDRLWIDHLPRNDRDTIKIFVALTHDPVGAFQATSAWKGEYEVFQYEASGGEMRVVYPQDRAKEKVTLSARACRERDMDYCLEIDGASRGVRRYYSMKGWEIDGAIDERTLRTRAFALTR